jgi:predicted HTH domain antitoxin
MKLNTSIVKSLKTAGVSEPPDEVVRESVALFLFQKGLISAGKAAEVSDLGLARFMDLLQSMNIPFAEYGQDDFAMDSATLKRLKAGRRKS